MAQSTTASLATLYSELIKFGQSGDYDKALKATNKILQEAPEEDKAFHCKIVCLIHLSKFDEALKTAEKNPKLSGSLVFERAYCLYRVNRIKDAYELLKADSNASFRNQELLAQVLYRLEKYEECFETYRNLIKNSEDDYEEERETNFAAVLASLSSEEGGQAGRNVPQLRDHTYELCYNKACILLAQNKYKDAAENLKIAEDLCRKTLEEEDTPEEDVDEELGVIRCQNGYALQQLGQKDKALNLYNLVLRKRPTDVALVAVASNNIVTINKDQNVFESKKRMKAATASDLSTKLTSGQRCVVALNQGLFLLHTNQLDLCRKHLEKLPSDFPPDRLGNRAALIRAAMLCRDKQYKEAVSLLKEFLSSRPDQSLDISLTLVQLLLSQGQAVQACQVLQSLEDLTHRLGLVSALVTLYGSSLKDKNRAGTVLKNSLTWHRKNNSSGGALPVLIRESAQFYLRNGQAMEAAAMLEEQRKTNPNDPKILAQLISAYAQFDPKKSKEISQNLLPLDEIYKHVDVVSLENSNWSMGAKYIRKSKVDPSPGSPQDKILQKQKKKRRRKGKLPKNFDPNVDPDPERWLPRRERSTYKKKKDRRGGTAVGKGTQGAVGGAPELDITKGSLPSPRPGGASAGSTANQSSPNPQGPRQQRPQPVIKKKKKKGGRW